MRTPSAFSQSTELWESLPKGPTKLLQPTGDGALINWHSGSTHLQSINMFFLNKKWVNTGVPRQGCRNDMLMHSGAAPRASVGVFQGQTIPAAASKQLLGGAKQGNREESTSLRSHMRKKGTAVLLPAVPSGWLRGSTWSCCKYPSK